MKAYPNSFIEWRFYAVIAFILFIVAGLVTRLIDLTVINRSFLQTQGNVRAIRTVMSPAFRGMVTDRNGYPLAVSTTVYSAWIDPEDFTPAENLSELSKLLATSTFTLKNHIQIGINKNRAFVYLKRDLSPEMAKQIKALKLPGLNLEEDFKRFYPEGEVTAHVIGFTNLDDKGQEGLELLYNGWLAGKSGKRVVLKDRDGREISSLRTEQEQNPGKNITLSIDRRIQYVAYRELMTGVQNNLATSGTVVVLDVKTGEVLAMVNLPSFNPNNRPTQKSDIYRNRAVTDMFEPGSTMKAFSIANALASGLYKPDTMIDTRPGWFRVGHHLIHDENNEGVINVARVLQLSSDIGVSKMTLSLPPESLWMMLHRMGFGEATGVGFPGEVSGKLVKRPIWKPLALATLSFGYGMSATPLQLAHAYAAIANNGVMLPLSLLKIDHVPEGKQVMDKKIANEMLALLETVVNVRGGKGEKAALGWRAAVPGYRVAGKTGTARIMGSNGYEKHRYTSSFIGIAPVSDPRLVVAVIIHDPRGKLYYGGDISAPVFEKIMEDTLRILDIPPDNLATLQKTD